MCPRVLAAVFVTEPLLVVLGPVLEFVDFASFPGVFCERVLVSSAVTVPAQGVEVRAHGRVVGSGSWIRFAEFAACVVGAISAYVAWVAAADACVRVQHFVDCAIPMFWN